LNSGAVKVTGFNTLAGGDAVLTQALGTIGPITAYVYVGPNFQYYTSGIYSNVSECAGQQINHAIILDGYGTDASGNQYYILRNSWGTNWGIIILNYKFTDYLI